jgi:quercetin dioxygenase-like cupin family protein
MPFFDLDRLEGEHVTSKYSKAFGPLVTRQQIEVGRLRFGAGEGAVPHAHPQEQGMVVLTGRLRVTMDGQTRDLGPGEGSLAPSNVLHQVTALERAEVLSCRNVVEGHGDKT